MATSTGSFYLSNGTLTSKEVFYAIKAATMRKQIGRYAARRMAEKNGVPAYLYRLACQLLAAQ